MKKFCLLSAIALMTLITSQFAIAHGGRFDHFSLGINLGYPGFYGGYGGYGFYDPFFYPPFYGGYPVVVPIAPPVVVPPTPPVYIQQQMPAVTQPQTQYWYYCINPEGYYPYVKQCPGGWLHVDPRPTTQQ